MEKGSRRGAFLFGVKSLKNIETIGFEVDGYFQSEIKNLKWKDFRNALASLDWAFFGRTQDLKTGNLYLCGQFYHEKSFIILEKESMVVLEAALMASFFGSVSNIPLQPNKKEDTI